MLRYAIFYQFQLSSIVKPFWYLGINLSYLLVCVGLEGGICCNWGCVFKYDELQLLLKLSLLIRWHIPSSTQQLQVSESYRNTQHLDWSNNSNFYYQNDQNQPLYLIDWSCPTKDKVNASLDVTLVKVVCSKQIHEGVLCPQEPDIVEHGFVTVYTQCHCLHSRHSRPCNHWILQAVFTYQLYIYIYK